MRFGHLPDFDSGWRGPDPGLAGALAVGRGPHTRAGSGPVLQGLRSFLASMHLDVNPAGRPKTVRSRGTPGPHQISSLALTSAPPLPIFLNAATARVRSASNPGVSRSSAQAVTTTSCEPPGMFTTDTRGESLSTGGDASWKA